MKYVVSLLTCSALMIARHARTGSLRTTNLAVPTWQKAIDEIREVIKI